MEGGALLFSLYNSIMFEFVFPPFLKLEKTAEDLNCTNITDAVAPGRPDSRTFSC